MTRNGHPIDAERADRPSMDEWLLSVIAAQKEQTLETLTQQVPQTNWVQVLLAIDRLSRSGQTAVWPIDHGDHRSTLKRAARAWSCSMRSRRHHHQRRTRCHGSSPEEDQATAEAARDRP